MFHNYQAVVRVWDPHSLVTLAIVGQNILEGGVCSVAFSSKV